MIKVRVVADENRSMSWVWSEADSLKVGNQAELLTVVASLLEWSVPGWEGPTGRDLTCVPG
jgi:hypothetical protein